MKIFSIIICLFSLWVQGLTSSRKLSFHAHTGLASSQEKNIKSAFKTGFGFSYFLGKKTSLSFDFSYWTSNVKEEDDKLLNGKLSITPFLVSIQYTFLKEKDFTPYIFIGGGFVFTRFRLEEYISIPEVTIIQKVENGLALHFGAGVDIKITKSIVLFAEGLYLYRKATGETIISDMNYGINSEEFPLNLNSFLLQSGLKYIVSK